MLTPDWTFKLFCFQIFQNRKLRQLCCCCYRYRWWWKWPLGFALLVVLMMTKLICMFIFVSFLHHLHALKKRHKLSLFTNRLFCSFSVRHLLSNLSSWPLLSNDHCSTSTADLMSLLGHHRVVTAYKFNCYIHTYCN